MTAQVKIVAMTVDDCPYTCPECGTGTFTLEARGPVDALATVWGNCSNYHSWEDYLLTADDLRAIQAASTGRARAEDDDTFQVEIGGAVLAGILHPDVILDDLKRAGDVYWKRIIKPAIRRRKRAAIRAVKRPIRNGAAAAKAAAIGAAWDWQTGGTEPNPDYEPEPLIPCGAGCDNGSFVIESNVFDTQQIVCTVCRGTGNLN